MSNTTHDGQSGNTERPLDPFLMLSATARKLLELHNEVLDQAFARELSNIMWLKANMPSSRGELDLNDVRELYTRLSLLSTRRIRQPVTTHDTSSHRQPETRARGIEAVERALSHEQ
jgi:hypothetical protein